MVPKPTEPQHTRRTSVGLNFKDNFVEGLSRNPKRRFFLLLMLMVSLPKVGDNGDSGAAGEDIEGL